MWKVQCLCTSNGGTCSTVSHVSAVLIYVCLSHCILEESLFSYWTEICSGTTSNRVSKVKCLSFLWQLLSDLWCQHTLHKHLWISSSLRAPEWRHVQSHLPVAGYATVRHHTAAVSPSMQQPFYWCVHENKVHCMDCPTAVAFLHSLDNPHCMQCDYAIAICVSMVSSYYWEKGRDDTVVCGGCIWIQSPTIVLRNL